MSTVTSQQLPKEDEEEEDEEQGEEFMFDDSSDEEKPEETGTGSTALPTMSPPAGQEGIFTKGVASVPAAGNKFLNRKHFLEREVCFSIIFCHVPRWGQNS